MNRPTWLTWRRVSRTAGALTVLCLTAAAPWWGRAALCELAYFHVRRLEIVGATYLSPTEVYRRLGVDTTASVWMRTTLLEHRLARHPQVKEVHVERRLPGTLVIHVTERLPVALVPTTDGLSPVDGGGTTLPIDPSRTDLDLPIVPACDTAILRLLDELRTRQPALFARISELRREPHGELVIVMPPMLVRAAAGLSAQRLADILPVEQDLTHRQAHIAELDLRFRDQVVARLQ